MVQFRPRDSGFLSEFTPSKYSAVLLLVLVSVIVLIIGLNFAVDPLQVFRPAGYQAHLWENQRYQNPGLARHYSAPVLIIGTSHTENWRSSEVKNALGKDALKLSVAGSGLYVQSKLFDIAVESGAVQRVLWGVDHGSTLWRDRPTDAFGAFPDYLYGSPWRAIFPYLLSLDTTQRTWEVFTSDPDLALDDLNVWYDTTEFGGHRINAAWDAMAQRWGDDLYDYFQSHVPRWEEVQVLVKKFMLSRAIEHPDVRFDLIFFPYSVFEYINDFRIDKERFFQRLLLKQEVARWGLEHANIYVWDFQGREDWVYDESRYSDLAHFDLQTSQAMLEAISKADEPWPVLSAKEHVEMVLKKMAELCGESEDPGLWCPPRIKCGQYRLQRWLSGGADDSELLNAAWMECDLKEPSR